MVREATRRKRRYESGIDPDVIGKRFEQLKPVMVDLESEYFPQISLVESKVKQLVEAAGVSSYQVAQYINVGRVCYSLNKNFSQATRDAEAQRVVNHWAERGLDPTLLRRACEAGGCNPVDPPLPPGFQELEDKLDLLLAGLIFKTATPTYLHYPQLAPAVMVAAGAGAWVWGGWTQVIPAGAITQTFWLAGISVMGTTAFGANQYGIGQIGVGAAAAEVAVADWGVCHDTNRYGGPDRFFPVFRRLPANTRVACQLAGTAGPTAVLVKIIYAIGL